jgi:hypothetical protein
MKTVLAALAAALLAGCSTEKNVKAAAGWARDYYGQPNAAEILVVEGTNVAWQITGASRIVLSTPVPTKSVIPREPGIADGFFETVRAVAPWIFMGWAIHDGGFGSDTTTVNNNAAQ